MAIHNPNRWPTIALFAGLLVLAALPQAFAQAYPNRPIRLIVPFPPGGGADIGARIVAERASKALGQPIVIDNRPGADGNIGTDIVAKSAPDGYTIGVAGQGPVSIGKKLFPLLPYEPTTDLTPVIFTAESPLVLIVNPDVPAKTVKELVELAKKNPDRYNIAVSSAGSIQHFLTEMFKSDTGVQIQSIPYKGGAPTMVDLMGGQVQVAWAALAISYQYIKSGKLRALATATTARTSFLPDVPTMAEAGYPTLVGTSWNGIVAPAGTPKAAIDRLNQEFAAALKDPAVQEKLAVQGLQAVGGSPQDFAAYIKADSEKFGAVIKAANITLN